MEHVVVVDSGRVRRLRIDRADKKNALDRAMYLALAQAIESADADPGIRVITITGTHDAFTSGNDLNDFLRGTDSGPDAPVMRFLRAAAGAAKPLIAGVNGLAVGVGVTLLLHCDLVYAAPGASFQLPFVNLGLVPEGASTLLLPRAIGHQRAAELLMLGDRFDAQKARELGIVNAIHPREMLDQVVAARAAELAAKPPQALQLTKQLMRHGTLSSEVSARMEEERVLFERQLSSPEAREAMRTLLEKRSAPR